MSSVGKERLISCEWARMAMGWVWGSDQERCAGKWGNYTGRSRGSERISRRKREDRLWIEAKSGVVEEGNFLSW